jgi:uncharacterized protein YyaL (SSP411 family)
LTGLTTPVRWLPWNARAFGRARAEDKPVLLSIAAFWSGSCHEMDRTTYADPEIAARIQDQFIPIRVDADRRPDIAERYSLGGWPTTAFLTADGEVVGGGTFVAIERMPSILDRVVDAWRSGHVERAGQPTIDANVLDHDDEIDPGIVVDEATATLLPFVYESYDPEYGGFGTEPKFPLTAPLELALAIYRQSQDVSIGGMLERTLIGIGSEGLYDPSEGGFFRCAASRNWSDPSREKLLDVNAALIRIFLEASETLNAEWCRDRAVDGVRFVQTWLADQVDGGWFGSQQAPSDPTPPPVDSTMYVASNAAMVSAALRAAELLDDSGLGEFAIKSLERVVVATYRPGFGVAHHLGKPLGIRGLLDDHIAMAAAHLDAHEATGNVVYEMMAQELLHYAIRAMWDEQGGGFFDRTVLEERERIGRLRDRLKPFVSNCEAARVLRRAAVTPGDHDFGARADATLAAMAPLARAQGPLAAHYLLARLRA